MLKSGAKNMASKKKPPASREVRPVRPYSNRRLGHDNQGAAAAAAEAEATTAAAEANAGAAVRV